MAPPAGGAGGEQPQGQQQRQSGFGITGIIRIAVFWICGFNLLSSAQPIWHETNIPYAVWDPESTRTLSLKYHPSESLKKNGSLYVHTFFARSGYTPDPSDPEYQPLTAFGRTYPIVVYFPKSKSDKRKHLLGNTEGSEKVEKVHEVKEVLDNGPAEWILYWKPNITINLVEDFSRLEC